MANQTPLKLASQNIPAQFASGDTVAVANGGTGATTSAAALANLRAGFTDIWAYANVATTIPQNTLTTIIWNNVNKDAQSEYNASTGVVTIKNAGTYALHANIFINGVNPASNNFLTAQSNGVEVMRGLQLYAGSGGSFVQTITGILNLNAGDTLNVGVYTSNVSAGYGQYGVSANGNVQSQNSFRLIRLY